MKFSVMYFGNLYCETDDFSFPDNHKEQDLSMDKIKDSLENLEIQVSYISKLLLVFLLKISLGRPVDDDRYG